MERDENWRRSAIPVMDVFSEVVECRYIVAYSPPHPSPSHLPAIYLVVPDQQPASLASASNTPVISPPTHLVHF